MRTPTILLSAIAVFTAVDDVTAQVEPFPNTGCYDKSFGADGPAIRAVGGVSGEPIVPSGGSDLTFGLQVPCGIGPTSAGLFLWGGCGQAGAAPTFNWPMTDPCFGAWEAPPTVCNGAILTAVVHLLDGALADAAGYVTFPFPLIDLRPAIDLVELSQSGDGFCLQFLCLDLVAPSPCTAVSQGARIVLHYN